MTAVAPDHAEHREFLNRYYGWSRSTYDWTRRYFLFGRNEVLAALAHESWDTLVEVGPGTGRNLAILHETCPGVRLGGVEASDAMLEVARKRCPYAALVHGFAEEVDLTSIVGSRPDRILFSYTLSMIQDPRAALENAMRSLAPGGRVVVVDFGDGAKLPSSARAAFHRWLKGYRVTPVASELFFRRGATLRYGLGRYWIAASIEKLGT